MKFEISAGVFTAVFFVLTGTAGDAQAPAPSLQIAASYTWENWRIAPDSARGNTTTAGRLRCSWSIRRERAFSTGL